MISKEEIIPALATWIMEHHEIKIAAVQLPMGVDSDIVKKAVEHAGAEGVYVSMNGLEGVDLASAARTPIAVTFKKKVIVVFEYDAMVTGDQGLLAHVSAAIKVNKVPVVLVGNSFRSKASSLPKDTKLFQVVSADPHDHIRAITKFPEKRDSLADKGLAGAEAVFSGIHQDYRGDGIALGGVFDNYLVQIDNLEEIADAFSWADVVSEGMCRAGSFDDPYSFVPLEVSSLAFRKCIKKPTISTFGTVWSKTNAMYAKINTGRMASRTMIEAGSAVYWTPVSGIDSIRGMIVTELQRNNLQGAVDLARAAGLTSAALLAIMRLWKTKYTLAMHAKIKKLLDV